MEKEYNKDFKFPTKEGNCPVCGRKLVKKNGECGTFYGCPGYPRDCQYSCSEKQYEAGIRGFRKPKADKQPWKSRKQKSKITYCSDCIFYRFNETNNAGICTFVKRQVGETDEACHWFSETRVSYNPARLGMICGFCEFHDEFTKKCKLRNTNIPNNRPCCTMFCPINRQRKIRMLKQLIKEETEKENGK